MTIKFRELTFKADVAMHPDLDSTETQNLYEAIVAAIADTIATTAKGRILIGQSALEIEENNA